MQHCANETLRKMGDRVSEKKDKGKLTFALDLTQSIVCGNVWFHLTKGCLAISYSENLTKRRDLRDSGSNSAFVSSKD